MKIVLALAIAVFSYPAQSWENYPIKSGMLHSEVKKALTAQFANRDEVTVHGGTTQIFVVNSRTNTDDYYLFCNGKVQVYSNGIPSTYKGFVKTSLKLNKKYGNPSGFNTYEDYNAEYDNETYGSTVSWMSFPDEVSLTYQTHSKFRHTMNIEYRDTVMCKQP